MLLLFINAHRVIQYGDYDSDALYISARGAVH